MIGCRLSLVVLMHDCRRFFSMDPHVLFEIATLTESFSTDFTHIGSFTRVQPGMNHHLVSLSEGFMAELTLVGSSVRVNSLVFSHQISALKTFGAVSTLIGSFAGMNDPVVQGHFGPAYKTSSALFADKWPLACMDPTMLLHIAFLRKALMAEIAIVGLNA